MKTAYFDCFSGASGDMFIGALLDAGLPLERLELELEKIDVSGFRLTAEKGMKRSLSGTKFDVEADEEHVHRHLRHIIEIVDQSTLSESIKTKSKAIFTCIATAEARIHQSNVEKVHFHEVGGLDSIVDIIGSVTALELLGIENVCCSKIHVGTGFVKCQHGEIPVPAPATLEILKGLPIYSRGIDAELVTPTGAVLLKNLCSGFGAMPPMRIDSVGYGLGSRDLEIPNMLRVFIGETETDEYDHDQVVLIETNIDDMSPEVLNYTCAELLRRGALDVWMAPIVMKKGRLGTLLSVLTRQENQNACLATVFSETTSLGVRIEHIERQKLVRESISVKTRFGQVDVKIARSSEEVKNIAPEYESCRQLAVDQSVPLKDVYDEAKSVARKQILSK